VSALHDLAVDGGAPIRTNPLPRWPAPGEDEIQAVTEVLRSGHLNYWTGQEGRSFEREYAASLGRAHGIALANGTLALELALRSFGIGTGDEVIVPSRTFIATASAVVAVGATPVVADIDLESGNMTADSAAAVATSRTRAIIPVHLGGWPVDMDRIVEWAREESLIVIEDCAQAHGGVYRERPVGALGSHAAAFSFCQDKILPTGEGGMLVLDDEDAYRRAWEYKDHGKSLQKVSAPNFGGAGTSYKWLIDSFGTNWRMDEMSASVGRVGLRLLPEWHAGRVRHAQRLMAGLADTPGLHIPVPESHIEHAYYRLYALVESERLAAGWDRDRITTAISAEGVPVQYGSCAEIYREAAFANASLGPAAQLPVASEVHERSVAFFVHPTLGDGDIDDTVAAVIKVMGKATR